MGDAAVGTEGGRGHGFRQAAGFSVALRDSAVPTLPGCAHCSEIYTGHLHPCLHPVVGFLALKLCALDHPRWSNALSTAAGPRPAPPRACPAPPSPGVLARTAWPRAAGGP